MQAALLAPLLSAGSSVAGGLAARSQAQGEKQLAENNAYIGRTRAIQTDVSAREGLNAELGTLRATLAGNNQRPNVGTQAIMDDLRKVRSRDRRIEFGNRMSEAAQYRLQAKNAGKAGNQALLGGLIKAGPSLFEAYDVYKKR